jgi:hypothetical protein
MTTVLTLSCVFEIREVVRAMYTTKVKVFHSAARPCLTLPFINAEYVVT